MEGHFSRRDPLRRVPAAVLFAALSLLIAVLIGLGTAATASAQAPVPGKLTVQRGGLTVAATSSGMNTTGAAAVSDDCSAGDGVCLYEHTSFGGRWVRFVGTGCYADFSQIGFNDLASSLRFTSNYGGGRYSVVLYEHAYFGGIYSGFGTDDLNFSNNEIGHDRASSICIDTVPQCTGDGVYLYEHTNYAGRCRKFTENNDNFRPTGFNDVASSVRLVGAFGGGSRKVTLCEHSGYGGACSAFSGDDPDLRDDVVGNDRTSSLRIEASTGTACPPITDWKGEYWNNKTLSGSPVLCRNDANVNFEWGAGGPGGGISSDNFSARWTRDWNFAGGRYRFHLRGDDGIRLWLDGNLIIDQWKDQGRTEYSVERDLAAGWHNLRVEYYENTVDANVALWWTHLSGTACPTITDWKGEYWNNKGLSGSPVLCRNDANVNFEWGAGGPGGGVPNDNFSARWTRDLNFAAGRYRFHLRGDDGIRLWLDNNLIIDQWRDQGRTEYSVERDLTAGWHNLRVEYYENTGDANVALWWTQLAGVACPTITDWKGEYWNNKGLSGSPVLCRNDASVNFEWGAGGPGGGVPSDNFSARWTRDWNFAAGRYRFHLRGDDGIRLWLDNNLIIDQWKDQARTQYSVERDLTAGSHNLRVEYYENTGDASVALWWETTSGTCPTFRGDYFNNPTLSGSPAFTVFEKCPIDLTWGQNGPGGGIGNDRFSVRWTGRAHFNAGTYTFIARADDGIRAWVNNTLIIDEWRDQAATEFRRTLTLTAGDYDIRVEYYENAGNAVAQFRWEQAAAATGVVKSDKPAFDTCRLPLVSEMRDWWSNSPYYEANIYLGGVNRSCKDWNQQNLTPSWVQAVHSQGWNFIPTWVGPQAPCNTSGLAAMSGDAGAAFNQGRAEADAAVNAAKAVGLTSLGSGQTVIYYAMAPYPNNASCRNTVKSFMSGWAGRLRELGMRSGGYGASCASYVSDWATTANVPDNVWAATANWPAYDPSVTVWNVGGCLSNSLWTNRQRIFQYTPGHNEWWGSTTLNIDSNIAGGDVAGTHVRLAGSAAAAAAAPGVAGPASGEIVAAELVTADEGWVLTGDRLLWSADRGTRWTDITPAGVASPRMAGAAFVDSQRGWVVFSGRAAEGLLVARTADGGRNWSITPLAGAGADAGDVSLSFADAATGWISVRLASGSAFSVAALFGTRDGGATWAPLTVPVAGPIRFISAMTGWVAGGSAGDELYVTRDGGRSWQPQPGLPRSAPGSAQFLYGLPSFENAAEGVIPVTVAEAARPRVEYYRTGDGGASWQLAAEVALQRRPAAAASTAILGGRRLMAVDPGSGTLQMVEPDGRLRRSAPSTGLQDGAEVDFATPEVGWAVRRYGSCQGDKDNPTAAQPFTCEQHADLLRTVDGGATWEVLRP